MASGRRSYSNQARAESLMSRFKKYSRTSTRAPIGGESGYAVLLAIFLVATLLLVTAVATPNVLTQGRRQKEQEMVWRGNQYVRGVSLFFRKNGRYPQSLEQLTKPSADNVHFLRKAYADPMNTADGSWRLIYVSPSGQLIGSVHYRTLSGWRKDRKSTRLNSSHTVISYAVFCLKKKKK